MMFDKKKNLLSLHPTMRPFNHYKATLLEWKRSGMKVAWCNYGTEKGLGEGMYKQKMKMKKYFEAVILVFYPIK